MRKMTQNEAKEYVNDINHWYVVGTTEYARVRRLDYENLTYIAIQTKHMNMTEWHLHKEAVIEWTNSLYYKYDKEHDCFDGPPVRPTEMSMEIWRESRRADS